MARLEALTKGAVVRGLFGDRRLRIVNVDWHGSGAITLTYTDELTGRAGQELLYRDDEPRLSVEQAGRAWSMDGDAQHFRLASEAKRISLAYLFDPFLAVQSSNLDPLPHQVGAVYNRMLPLQPLRFLLADDPGAGKTIMAGLLCKELMIRGDVERCLVIAPGSLVEQWQDELWQKFALDFRILTREMIEATSSGNPFAEQNLLIARLDHLSRNEELQARLRATDWDLVIVDEAHKMSAHYTGGEIRETKRYRLGQLAGSVSRHLLLMTATPHAGIDADYRRAEELRRDGEGSRGAIVGFALTTLQRRLASSPEAIYQSLRRRRERLERRACEARIARRGAAADQLPAGRPPAGWREFDDDFDTDDLPDGDLSDLETELVDEASAARTVAELEREIAALVELERLAGELRSLGEDRKWEELSALLTDTPEMYDASGGRRKVQEAFTQDPRVLVLVATDAAGEGINLQRAHLMVNYDLPWNPNRIEQRFGRIHRIGQTEVCHLWNLVAEDTREGQVFQRLFEKLDEQRRALGGQVFDVLGQVLDETVGDALREVMHQRSLVSDLMTAEDVEQIREQMDRAQARRLQPYFVRSYFIEAFALLGGEIREREPGRLEITKVPAEFRQRDRLIGTGAPVPRRYERITFDRDQVIVDGSPRAQYVAPGHPLLEVTVDLIVERFNGLSGPTI